MYIVHSSLPARCGGGKQECFPTQPRQLTAKEMEQPEKLRVELRRANTVHSSLGCRHHDHCLGVVCTTFGAKSSGPFVVKLSRISPLSVGKISQLSRDLVKFSQVPVNSSQV